MTELDILDARVFATSLAEKASNIIRVQRPERVSSKTNPADLCTEKDVDIEQLVRESIRATFPDHALEGEELGRSGAEDAEYTWYVDPIDGTTNYVAGLPWSSFSLALADGNGAQLGMVADPHRGEMATAVRGRGTEVDGARVWASGATSVAGQVILTEWSGHVAWPGMQETMAAVTDAYGTIRIMGSSALALYSVALGHAAGAIIGSFHLVDDLAGVLLAQEAGAVVLERAGGVMVAAPGVAEELALLWKTGTSS